jgi:hypothetical protein
MKLLAAIAVAVAVALPATAALACAPAVDVAEVAPERARGVWPWISERDGELVLELHDPELERSGRRRYVTWLRIVDDDRLHDLRWHLRWNGMRGVVVTVEEVGPDLWRVAAFEHQGS